MITALDKTGELILFVDEQNPGIGVMGREIPPGQAAANRTDVHYIYQTDKPGLSVHNQPGPILPDCWCLNSRQFLTDCVCGHRPAAHPDADITVAEDGTLYWTDVSFLREYSKREPFVGLFQVYFGVDSLPTIFSAW